VLCLSANTTHSACHSYFCLGAWEANIPVFGAPGAGPFKWSPFQAGNLIALGGICTVPFLLGNVFFARRVQDRLVLALGSGLTVAGLLTFIALLASSAHHTLTFWSVFACWWAIATGCSMATMITVSLLSKQLPPQWNNMSSLFIQYSNYTGRVTGAVFGKFS
jgi:predicted MFS family arabinose efflux permease